MKYINNQSLNKGANTMVRTKTLKDYEFESIYDYCGMVLDSLTNGQRAQAKKQALTFSKAQRLDFLCYLDEIETSKEDKDFFIKAFILN